jgi:signal transduction histidine kinase
VSVASVLSRLALLGSLLAFSGLLAYSSRHARDPFEEAAFERDLGRLWAVDARLDEDLLAARAGLVGHYDQLVRDVQQLWTLHRRVSRALAEGDTPHPDLSEGLARAADVLREKERLLEQFKAHDAVLRNSRQYLPELLRTVRERLRGAPLAATLDAHLVDLLRAILLVSLPSTRDESPLVRSSLEHMSLARPLAARLGAEADWDLLIEHARVTLEREAQIDRLLERALTSTFADDVARLSVAHSVYQRAARDAADLRHGWLFALGLLCIALASAEVIGRLRLSARALVRASEELKTANQALLLEGERERELGEQKTRFVSMTSHEFRTPLSTILSSSELLERYGERWDVERRNTHLARIRSSARNMGRMLEEILLIGRAEAGVLSPIPGVIELRDYCERLIETISRTSQHSHPIRLELAGAGKVWLDERLLTHVLSNLLDNAIKYSPLGSEVELALGVHAARCELSVSDRGIGVPEADKRQLFHSFQRGSNVGSIRGSGLGLAIVKRVLDVQGGSIRVESELGVGSRFSVTLPLERSAEQTSAEPACRKAG